MSIRIGYRGYLPEGAINAVSATVPQVQASEGNIYIIKIDTDGNPYYADYTG